MHHLLAPSLARTQALARAKALAQALARAMAAGAVKALVLALTKVSIGSLLSSELILVCSLGFNSGERDFEAPKS